MNKTFTSKTLSLTSSICNLYFVRKQMNAVTLVKAASLIVFIVVIYSSNLANAATFTYGDTTITLNTTLSYSLGVRTAPVNSTLASALNGNDGDLNFRSGIMENRVSALEELDIKDGDYGLHASGEAYLDAVYLQHNKNNSPNTFNSVNIGRQSFPSGTVATDGRRIEGLAAYVFGSENFNDGNDNLSWRVGRQTISWGQSLFFPDGISGGQQPVDVYSANALPDPKLETIFLPTAAASVAYQAGSALTVQGYWQFEYEADQLTGTGSYFSTNDFVGPGGQRILLTPNNQGGVGLYHGHDLKPNGLDQFGLAMTAQLGDWDAGLYFVRFDAKTPSLYVYPGAATSQPNGVGKYALVYGKGINLVGASFSTLVGSVTNLAGEISLRNNQPLAGGTIIVGQGTRADNGNHNLYPVGDVVNLQLSTIITTNPFRFFPNGVTVEGETVLNRVMTVTKNRQNLATGMTADGGAFQVQVTPTYFIGPTLQVDIPVGLTCNFLGKSLYDGGIIAGTGIIDAGLTLTYRGVWVTGFNYQRYYGGLNGQPLLDRDFATVFIHRSF